MEIGSKLLVWALVCVCVLDTCPSLWGSRGEMSGSFSRGSYVQEKKEEEKKKENWSTMWWFGVC